MKEIEITKMNINPTTLISDEWIIETTAQSAEANLFAMVVPIVGGAKERI